MKSFRMHGLVIHCHAEVYDPAEDTFQLLEAIQVDAGDRVLEVGTGCGVIALECARQGASVVCTDVNPHAVKVVQENIRVNKGRLKGSICVREGDLFAALDASECFDVIIFNPPYLPTGDGERVDTWFDCAVDGGATGLEVTKQFLKDVKEHLWDTGCVYVVVSSLADEQEFRRYAASGGLKYEVVSSCRYDDEVLSVYRLSVTVR